MPKGTSKSTAAIQRLLEERRQYEAWLARIDATADATPEHVRVRVRADYVARLAAVTEELKAHAEEARLLIAQRKEARIELQKKEARAAERLAETELRHSVGEYDESQWTQVHQDVLNELVQVREELQAVDSDIAKLLELDGLVRVKPGAADKPLPRVGPAPKPKSGTAVDELAFLKSVTEDDAAGPSAKRASGAQFQPVEPAATPRVNPALPTPLPESDGDQGAEKTLKCRQCGTMNGPTEWYCENCGAELSAM